MTKRLTDEHAVAQVLLTLTPQEREVNLSLDFSCQYFADSTKSQFCEKIESVLCSYLKMKMAHNVFHSKVTFLFNFVLFFYLLLIVCLIFLFFHVS